MPESRDTAPDGTPRTDRDQAPDSSDPRATPSVPTPEVPPPFEPDTPLERLPSEDVPVSPEAPSPSTPSPAATRAPDASPADDAAPVTDAVPEAPVAHEIVDGQQDHTPVPRERKALVGLETTYRSENASKTTSSTGGFTQRSLPEVERPTSSLRVAEGRFAAIEQKQDQLEARLRLLEKQSEKAGGGALPRWALWVFFLLVIVVVHLLSRRF
jgi:hypothetical protein